MCHSKWRWSSTEQASIQRKCNYGKSHVCRHGAYCPTCHIITGKSWPPLERQREQKGRESPITLQPWKKKNTYILSNEALSILLLVLLRHLFEKTLVWVVIRGGWGRKDVSKLALLFLSGLQARYWNIKIWFPTDLGNYSSFTSQFALPQYGVTGASQEVGNARVHSFHS